MADTPEKWHPAPGKPPTIVCPIMLPVALIYGSVNQHTLRMNTCHNPIAGFSEPVKVGVSEEANRRVPEAML